jgi:hypothetical protein
MEEKVKMMIGAIIIIGIMILSYKLFPTTSDYSGGVDIKKEINSLTNQVGEIELNPAPLPYEFGPGDCDSLEDCLEYCAIPENEQECSEFYTPDIAE